MKRLLIILALLTLIFALTACGKGDDKPEENENPHTTHSYTQDYEIDDDYHWLVCSECGEIANKAYHTLDDNGVCTTCEMPILATDGVVYGVSADGTYAKVIRYTGTATKVKIAKEYEGLSVKEISMWAFSNNSVITTVIIPDSVTSIAYRAFDQCPSLTDFTVGKNNPNYKSIDGNLYSKDGKTLIRYAIGKTDTSFTISDSVTSIGDYAFSWCNSLKSVVIPDSVTSIGECAFGACFSLTSVVIGDSVTSIGGYAFQYCDSLTSVVIGDSVTSIGEWAFWSCSSLTSVVIPDSVTSIGYEAFYNCTSLTDITVGKNNPNYKSIDGNLYSKDGKTLIRYAMGKTEASFTIPDSVTSIGDYAFEYCDSLTSVVIGDSVTSIGNHAFTGCTSLTSVVIGDSVTSIGDSAFTYCDSLTSVVIPDSVTSIGDSAFAYCDSLTSVVIGDSVTSIGNHAFEYCSALTSVVIPDSVTSIGNYAFYNCHSSLYTEYEYGTYVRSGDNPYFLLIDVTNNNMSTYTIHEDTRVIGVGAFSDCDSLTYITVGKNNPNYKSIDGNLYSKDGKTLIQYAIGKTDTSFTIPDSVTSIGDWAFYGCTSLTSVVIPDSVTSIGDSAFANCTSLTSVVIPDSVTSIGEWAFVSCSALTSVVIGDSVTSIGDWAFENCSSLTDVYYTGSEAQWAEISIGDYNSYLTNATKHYNYVPEEN